MERERKIKIMTVAVAIVAVIGLTVAFAAMSTSLLINGTASMDTAKWDIHFDNLSEAELDGFARVETEPTLEQTKIGDYAVVLTRPGDSVTYTFDVVNEGSMDAELSTFTKNAPVCTSPTGVVNDGNIVCANLRYTFKYTSNNEDVKVNDTLKAGETKNITLKLSYEGSTLPTAAVNITDLGITMIYSQMMGESNSVVQASPASWFAYVDNDSGITITGPTETMLETVGCSYNESWGLECTGEPFDLIIPETIDGKTVTKIGEDSFAFLNYKKVVIPNTVTAIEDNAFYHNEENGYTLVELQLSKNLTSIGAGAFSRSGLTEVTIPEGVTDLNFSGSPFYFNHEDMTLDIIIILPTTLKTLTGPLVADQPYTGTIVNKSNLIINWADIAYWGESGVDCTFATGTCEVPGSGASFNVVSSENDL